MTEEDTRTTTDDEDLARWVTWAGLLASAVGVVSGVVVAGRERPALGIALAALAAGIGAVVVLGNIAVRLILQADRTGG